MSRFAFELCRAEIAKRRVYTLSVVPNLDVLEDGDASLNSRIKGLLSAFGLERAEKTFHGSVVKAIANLAHADLAVMSG